MTLHAAGESDHVASRNSGLRVLVLGVSWPMETFLERLFVGLSSRGIEVTVATTGSFARPPAEWSQRHQIRWTDEMARRSLRKLAKVALRRAPGRLRDVARPPSLLRGTERSRRRLLNGRWDVIYVPWVGVLVDLVELMEQVDTPLVVSCRGSLISIAPLDPSRDRYREGLHRAFEAATAVHCVSDAILRDAIPLGLDPTTARVIRPAVNPDMFAPRGSPSGQQDPTRVLAIGSLIWRKDYEHALRSVRTALDRGADLRLTIVGDGPDRARLLYSIDDLGLGDHVELVGRLAPDKVADLLQNADVFLHTSSSEGISNAVLEAMASGLPVITTDAGGMREAVRDGADGFLVGVRDTTAMADALVTLVADASMRARMGASARDRVLDRFRLDQQIDAFVELFHEVAGR